jgi:DNA-directed RNA polymerase specialized sigma24 family protein
MCSLESGNVVEAEDLTEDVFLRMLGAISGYRIEEIFGLVFG